MNSGEVTPKKPYMKPTLTTHKSLRDITAVPVGLGSEERYTGAPC